MDEMASTAISSILTVPTLQKHYRAKTHYRHPRRAPPHALSLLSALIPHSPIFAIFSF
jgi:hypothetical protein